MAMQRIMEEQLKNQEDIQTRKVIVIGAVGSGKTSLARYICGIYDQNEDSKLSGLSQTKGVKSLTGNYIVVGNSKIKFTCVDSEGYGADEFVSETLSNQLLDELRHETELHGVVLVVSFERFRSGLKTDLRALIGLLQTLGVEKNIILVFTHGELLTEKVKNNYRDEFLAYYEFNCEKQNIVYGCFANLDEIKTEYQDMIGSESKNSIEELQTLIGSKNEVINTATIIHRIESGKAAQPPAEPAAE